MTSSTIGTTLIAPVQTAAELPANPVIGAIAYIIQAGETYIYTGSAWVPMPPAAPAWRLFLDDKRIPADVGIYDTSYTMATSTAEAQEFVELDGLPTHMSLDHDLGGDDTAFKFMWWLINGHLDERWDLINIQQIQVHSANPEGAKKLIALWTNFCRVHCIDTPIGQVWPKGAKR